MEQVALELAEYLLSQLQSKPQRSRVIAGIGGIPASGKTTLASMVCTHVNNLSPGICVVVPMDGWHYTRAKLREFPNPKEAFDRRGAEWTFDAEGYTQFVSQLCQTVSSDSSEIQGPSSRTVTAPSFDHAVKDPIPDAISVTPSHHIVLIEGLYVLLGTERWGKATGILDERWLVEVGLDEASQRLLRRHVQTGVAETPEEALWRIQNNDLPNGLFMMENMMEPTRRITSITEPLLGSI